MTGALFYPPADRASQWFGGEYPGVTMPMDRVKLILHTTETAGGWPDYAGGAKGPTLTYDPWAHKWRQHFRLSQSARALQDPEGTPVRENRADVVQVEISAYCDPARFSTGHGVNRLDEQAYNDLGAFVAFLAVEWGLPLASPAKWLPYPKSYGAANGVRLSSADYAKAAGVLGHQHVPGNVHGDPGALDVPRILDAARVHLTRGRRVDIALELLERIREDTTDTTRAGHLDTAITAVEAIPPTWKP